MREPETEKVNIFQIQIKMVEVGYILEGAFSDFLRIITIGSVKQVNLATNVSLQRNTNNDNNNINKTYNSSGKSKLY